MLPSDTYQSLMPRDEADLADIIASARAPMVIEGGGTRLAAPPLGDVLRTQMLTGVVLYEPAALTLVAWAGTPLADLRAVLAAQRQRLAFEPPDMRGILGRANSAGESTIGGVVAANASGPRRVQSGACRDSLIGLRMVDGQGRIIKNGGRVMKNVTGYDLVKLMAGSYGALGVICEVAFKVQAMPEAEVTLAVSGLDEAAGLAVLRRALGTPYDVSGAARAGGVSYIRIEGMEGSTAYRAGQLRALIAGDTDLISAEASAALWRGIGDARALVGRVGDLWRLSVLPTDAAAIVAALAADPLRDVVYDWGGGLIWAVLPHGRGADVARALGGRGAGVLLRGAGAAPFAAQPAQIAALSAALKAQFDPMARFAGQIPPQMQG
jgi:glycolate oxidase FAD binding subunit